MLSSERIKFIYFDQQYLEDVMKIRLSPEAYDSFFEYEPLNEKQQLSWWEESYLRPNEKNYIVISQEDKVFIGTISLVNIDMRNKKAELGRLYIDPQYRKGGFGFEVINILLQYAFDHLNLNKIYLEVFSHNTNAKTLYIKSGFEYTGTLKQHIFKSGNYCDVDIFSILKNYKLC